MKLSIAAGLLAFFACNSIAQEIQSKPFYLVLVTAAKEYNGTVLDSCHEGAAIEGLCPGGPLAKADASYETYQLNSTKGQPNSGELVWELRGGNFNLSEAMNLYTDPSTNVAIPLFEPDNESTYVSFDSHNKMYISTYLDDTVSPPSTQKQRNLYRWYVCETYYGYQYTTLAWAQGKYPPENPSCKKTDVVRVFKK